MQKSCLKYPVEFVDDAFGDSAALADLLKAVTGQETPEVFLVADFNVVQHTGGLGAKIGSYVQSHGIRLAGSPVVISGGEKSKSDSMQSVLKIADSMLSARLGRDGVVIAIGGGTLLDLAGYVASQVRGGRKIVRMPTTPAAMIDAAFSDVAGVNLGSVKDAFSVASEPAGVVIEPKFAMTVLDGVWRGGIGEAVRLAAVKDSVLVKKLAGWVEGYRSRDFEAFKALVTATHAVRAKKGGTNFAEWVALRLEAMSGYKLPHGYAVALGICLDTAYAVEIGLMKEDARATLVKILADCGAMEALGHSQHLLSQTDELLRGFDAWCLRAKDCELTIPTGLGKSCNVAEIDRDAYGRILKKLVSGEC